MQSIRSLFALFGRICIAAIFISSGIGKISGWDQTLLFMINHGITFMPELGLFLAICAEIFFGIMIVLGWHTTFAASLLALYLIPVTYFFHAFWWIQDPLEQYIQTINFMKNLAIFGGLICLATSGKGTWCVDKNRPE